MCVSVFFSLSLSLHRNLSVSLCTGLSRAGVLQADMRGFVDHELKRRAVKGIASMSALAPEAEVPAPAC